MKPARFIWILALAPILTEAAGALPRCDQVHAGATAYSVREVMDISRTGKAQTYVASPKTREDLTQALAFARSNHLKVTIKGTNHSQGGHNRREEDRQGSIRAIQLDMLGYNRILEIDPVQETATVQAGVTWRQLTEALNPRGLSVTTQQSSNIFSIGGSLSTNVHGRDIHGPLINSILSFKLMNSQGEETEISRLNNPDLFRAVIGGYGAFGILTEVKLKLVRNRLYQAHPMEGLSISNYVSYIRSMNQKHPETIHYGRLNVGGSRPLSEVSLVEWTPVPSEKVTPTWKGWKLDYIEKQRWISSMLMNLMRWNPTSSFGKWIKDYLDVWFGSPKNGTLKTRNNILNPPVYFLFDHFFNSRSSVDILQEYFVPPDKLEPFVTSMKKILDRHQVNLLNVTLRYIPKTPKSQDSLLSPYSENSDLVALVLYVNIDEQKGLANGNLVQYDGRLWTQELIDSAQTNGGSFYWPYHRWWSTGQIRASKQDLQAFFHLKDQVDPQNLFESDFLFELRQTLSP